jgi:uncharacterized circularly permuted ATP-grasp superfamily protein/uncharacterized alpha-E superfamily protein
MNLPEAIPANPSPGPLGGYRPPAGTADELVQPDGSIRPVWRPLIEYVTARTPEVLAQNFARGDAYLRDAGVYYRQYTGSSSTERAWPLSHIPVMISSEEWSALSAGIAERAALLERVIADLYGGGTLVSDGLLPAELVARNPEWLRPIVGISPRSGHYLHFLAFELGRSPDGSWIVLGDRTQAPSGAGFALENRIATARVFYDLYPQANVVRLAGFFRAFRDALNGLRTNDQGRVAILTPGQHTDTFFEHAYIARYLGFTLVEGEDLKVDNGQLAVRTINGPEPISALWRRLDSRYADPLELDENSALGTPGMVAALRAGALTMVNCLGSGVLETRALMAFLPRICEHLTGRPLTLPNIATWWCGQAAERAYVSQNLERMMIGPAFSTQLAFDTNGLTAFANRFSGAARERVADWLEEDGSGLVGQEAVMLSTTPAMIDGRLLPRPMIVRVFAARTPDGWSVMPGGYARIGRTEAPTALAMQDGGSVADVWVTSNGPVPHETLMHQSDSAFVRRMPALLPARAADNLYWLGRYVERAEFTVRTLRAFHLRLADSGGLANPLVDHLADFLDGRGHDPDEPIPASLVALFEFARNCAAKIRDRFSVDGWNALNDATAAVRRYVGNISAGDDAVRAASEVLRRLTSFSGLVQDNMFRFAGWRFLMLGRAVERGAQIADLLAVYADLAAPPGGFDLALEIGDSAMTHRRRYSVEINRSTVIDLLALDRGNPRSIVFQVDTLREQEGLLPQHGATGQMGTAARQILLLDTSLAVAMPETITTERLIEIHEEIGEISDALTERYLS